MGAHLQPPCDRDRPRVSVLMPVFNGAAFLSEAIESILGQTFTDFEFVIVDDASRDDTPSIIARFAAQDPRIRVITNARNAGLTRSLNVGLDQVRAALVARQDADDVSEPSRLESQARRLAGDGKLAVLGTAFMEIGADGRPARTHGRPEAHDRILLHLLENNVLCHGSVMFRASPDARYDESLAYAQDYDLWVRLARHGRLANLPEVLYRWRNHAEGVTSRHRAAQAAAAGATARRHLEFLIAAGRTDILLEAAMTAALPPAVRQRVRAAVAAAHRLQPSPAARRRAAQCLTPAGIWLRAALRDAALVRRCAGIPATTRWLGQVLVQSLRARGRTRNRS